MYYGWPNYFTELLKCRPVPLHHTSNDDPKTTDTLTTNDSPNGLDNTISDFNIGPLSLKPTLVSPDYVEFKFRSENVVFGIVIESHRGIKWLSSADRSISLSFSRNCFHYDRATYATKSELVRKQNL